MQQYDSDVQYVFNGGVALAYRLVGAGPIDLLYLPGFTSNVQLDLESPAQARFLHRLTAFARVIMMDRRGWGCSDRLSAGTLPPLETLMEDVAVVLDTVHSQRVAVWASGDNGLLGMLLAASHPDRVSALVLYDTTPSFLARDDMPWLPSRQEVDQRFRGTFGTREFARQAFMTAAPSAATDLVEFEWYVRWLRLSTTPGAYRAETERYLDTDLRHVLPSIHVPTLVLRRRDARGVGEATSRYVADHIPGARYVELDGDDLVHWLGDTGSIVGEVERFAIGGRDAPGARRRLASLLFTDIVSSTERAVEMGDREWTDLLESHHAAVRAEITRFGGREIDTAGDGFLVTFEGPAKAVRCAEAIRGALSFLGIRIRAGCHTGEVELVGSDIAGIAVHIASRIMSAADPDQILVSRTVKDLVAGSGLSFIDLGERTLKGVPEPLTLFAVA